MLKTLIFFDTETNGTTSASSVLSISAMKIVYNSQTNEFIKTGEYNRFYYRNVGEPLNEGAINVNGLTDDVISQNRENTFKENGVYPKYYVDDVDSFYEFCDGSKHFIAHNIKFDRQFIPFILEKQFDTMLENVDIVKIPSTNPYNKYKWPKLIECANYYGVKYENDNMHQSMYDVLIMARVFYVMFKKNHTKLLEFINS